MGYKVSPTNNIVRLIPLKGPPAATTRQCEALRREAGRCWSDMLQAHLESRGRQWLSSVDLGKTFKGQYALHSQSIQALAQKLEANVATARALRKTNPDARYPYRPKTYQTVTWKESAIRIQDGALRLSNGQGRAPLVLRLPAEYRTADIRQVELTWRADHYELCLTLDTSQTGRPIRKGKTTAGVDLGDINIAAVVTDKGRGVIISGRRLRWCKQLRNKRHAAYQARMDRCVKGSRRWQRLKKRRAQATAKFIRQQRDILHKASLQVVAFAHREKVARLAIGDVRDIQDGVDLGRQANQKISQWPHGQMGHYVFYKARRHGIHVNQIPEDHSTRTCSACGCRVTSAPRGRVFICPGCGSVLHRDANGAANICSRARFGGYGKVRPKAITHLRPLAVVRALDAGLRCSPVVCLRAAGERRE